MNTSTCIVVFAKAPVAGFAKTRLIPALGAQRAAALACRLLQHAVQQAVDAQTGSVELCVTPTTDHAAFQAVSRAHGVPLTLQGEGDLGVRMHRAFARLLTTYRSVILIGTDAPALDACMLQEACKALQDYDGVFVPAHDGGYALVGLRQPCPALFDGMVWSTSTVMQETRRRAKDAALAWHELPPVHDIDEPQDLAHLPSIFLLEN